MINTTYADYAWEQTAALLAIDSPSGFTHTAAHWVKAAFEGLGFDARLTTKGGVLVDLGGKDTADGLLLAAHADTLGCMVAEVKGNGRLRLTSLGGHEPQQRRNRKRPGVHPERQGCGGHSPAVQPFHPCQWRL